MILLDTNVLSETMRATPAPEVIDWLDAHTNEVWISSVTVAEISLGIALLPKGKRRDGLDQAARRMFEDDFAFRCLNYDYPAALRFADIVSRRRAAGRPITTQDAQIAAIALANGCALATRNIDGFLALDRLTLINPWPTPDPTP
ncbi:MAG: type II toxin-antitoxin system VapC family toxin [Pseudomonadota bacterium]